MIIRLDAVREQLRTVAEMIEEARLELLDIKGGLIPPRRERSREVDLDDNPSASTAIRAAIDCVNQELESVVRALLDAAAYQPERRPAASGEKESPPTEQGDRIDFPQRGEILPQVDRLLDFWEADDALEQVLRGARRLANSKRGRG